MPVPAGESCSASTVRPATFSKTATGVPADFFAWEAAGLGWLAQARAAGGAAVVGVREYDERHISLDRVREAPATPAAAEAFGRSLQATHALGADSFGSGPPGWRGDGYIGRQSLVLRSFSRWGEFYATVRLLPYVTAAHRAGTLADAALSAVHRVCDRLIAGDFDDGRPPSRIHGDLWGGNVLYDAQGAVLIDPAAHGGHGLTDVAMLDLFGTQHLHRVQAGYAEAADYPPGWRELIGLHQLHPVLVHAVSHGPAYGAHAHQIAMKYA